MVLQGVNQALQRGDFNGVKQGIQEALAQNMEPRTILYDGLLSAMETVGVKFKNNEVFVPEVLIAARAMNAGMELLKPKLVETGVESIGSVVLGTVRGDLHDIGKNLVRMMLEGAGLTVYDLGVDVSAEKFVAAIEEHNPDIVGLSALLTTTMGEMKGVIEAIEAAGLRDRVKIMVGGAPVTSKFAQDIGADLYAKDAAEASFAAKKFLQ